jgi:hypothetical protein
VKKLDIDSVFLSLFFFQPLVLLALRPVLSSVKTMDHHLVVVQCDVEEEVAEVATEYRTVAEVAMVVVVVIVVVIKTNQTFVISVYIFIIFFCSMFLYIYQ